RALIHYDNVPMAALSTLYWLKVAMGMALLLLVFLAAPGIARFYELPMLGVVLQVTSIALPLNAAGQQFRVLAEKEFRFAELALIEVAASCIAFVVAVFVAFTEGGVIALVSAVLSRSAASSILAWLRLSRGRRPMLRFQIADARP